MINKMEYRLWIIDSSINGRLTITISTHRKNRTKSTNNIAPKMPRKYHCRSIERSKSNFKIYSILVAVSSTYCSDEESAIRSHSIKNNHASELGSTNIILYRLSTDCTDTYRRIKFYIRYQDKISLAK